MIRQPSEVYRPRIPPKYARQVDEPEWMRKGLLLHLPMQENAGSNTYDSSRYGNDGALTGCKWVENGIEFNGSSDYINCGNDASLNITDAITIEAWVKINSLHATEVKGIIDKTSFISAHIGWSLEVDSASRLIMRAGNGVTSATALKSIKLNSWNYAVGVYTGTNLIVYVNGVASTPTPLANIADSGTPFKIGSNFNAANRFFDGSISDVRIMNRALSAAEIEAMYYASYHTYNSMRMRSVCASPVFMRRNPTMSGGMA